MAEEHVNTSVGNRGGYGYNYTFSVGWATKEQNITNNTTRIEAYASIDGTWIGWAGGTVSIWIYWYDAYAGTNTEIAYGSWSSGGYGQGGARTVSIGVRPADFSGSYTQRDPVSSEVLPSSVFLSSRHRHAQAEVYNYCSSCLSSPSCKNSESNKLSPFVKPSMKPSYSSSDSTRIFASFRLK